MQAFQTHTATQPISIQPLQTQQKPRVTEVWDNAEKHSLFLLSLRGLEVFFCNYMYEPFVHLMNRLNILQLHFQLKVTKTSSVMLWI